MPNKQPHYQWQRYLCPANEPYARTADGFLIPPETEQFWSQNQHLQTLHSLADQPCLILVGEPGIGKSIMLRQEAERLRQQCGPADLVLLESFVDYTSRTDLATGLFADDQFITWQNGPGKLYLFFDGLDETHERLDALLAGLIWHLHKLPLERLYLRISCRTAAWPSAKNTALCSLWRLTDLPIYKLTVLSRQDVGLAAQAHGLDPDLFMRELVRQEVTPLAAIPLTLKLLLGQRRPDGSLPASRSDLYFQACNGLCQEWNRYYTNEADPQNTTQSQRFIIAARLAAVTLFAGASTITTQSGAHIPSSTELSIRTVIGFGENIDHHEYGVDEHTLRATLNTGLFIPISPKQYVWPHRTFQEYLAAYYLNHHNIPLPQFHSLFEAPDEPGGKFLPQLDDTVAWLCSFRPDIKQRVLARDPMLLLNSDVSALSEPDRSQLVSILLDAIEKQHHFQNFDEYGLYHKLRHSHLAQQLQTYLLDVNLSITTRRLVIDIAERCQLVELQQNFVDLALDPAIPPLLRCDAADAVVRIGDATAKAQLKPLLHAQLGDFFDHLKGAALRALWPDHISTQQLFAAITSRGENYPIYTYHLFILNEVAIHLQPHDLPVALDWVTRNVTSNLPDHELEPLMDQIMQQALEHLDQPKTQAAAAIAILKKLEHHRPLFEGNSDLPARSAEPRLTEQQRHILFHRLLEQCVAQGKDPSLLIWTHPPLIVHTDLPWLIHNLYPLLSEPQQHFLAKIIQRFWHRNDPVQIELLYTATQAHPILAQHLANDFAAIALESDEARILRQLHRDRLLQEAERQRYRAQPRIPQITTLLDQIEQGSAELWWRLNFDLMIDTRAAYRHYLEERQPDITAMPGWQQADHHTQLRICHAAYLFLLHYQPDTAGWFAKPDISYPAEAAYRAFFLLSKLALNLLDVFSPDIWIKWTPALLNSHTWVHPWHEEMDHYLLTKVAQNASKQFLQCSIQLLELAPIRWQLDRLAQRLKPFWQLPFTQAIWHQLHGHASDLDYLRVCLPVLLHNDERVARDHCASLLAACNANTEYDREAAFVAATALLSHVQDSGWPELWPVIQTDATFGRDLFLLHASNLRLPDSPLVSVLTVDQLTALYRWLMLQFPHKADEPRPRGIHSPTNLQMVADVRDSLFRALLYQGTSAALTALTQLVNEFPDIPDAAHELYFARARVRQNSWNPVAPRDLLQLIRNSHLRLIDTPDQLLNVVIESLDHLQQKLKGQTPAAIDLWNEIHVKRGTVLYTPKEETRLSDYIKRYLVADLHDRGIVINREVQIRPRQGASAGQLTDLYVEAVRPSPNDPDLLTVVIEVKGNWHPELLTAMQTQLVDRYLRSNGLTHGLYLVGWYNCPAWDPKDGRRQKSRRYVQAHQHDRNQLDTTLTHSAKALSTDGIVVQHLILDTFLS